MAKRACEIRNLSVAAVFSLAFVFLLLSGVGAVAADWPTFMKDGSHRPVDDLGPVPPLKLKWTFDTGGPVYSSPVVSGGKLFVGSYDGSLYAIDGSSGEKLWSFETGGEILSTPAVSGGTVFFGSKDGNFYALNSSDGTLKWKFETGKSVLNSPVVGKGLVFFGSSDNYFYALDINTGKRRWRKRFEDYEKYSGIFSSPAFKGDNLYIAGKNMRIFALDYEGGAQIWSKFLNTAIYSSPAITDEVVYVVAYDRIFYALNINSGQIVFRKRLKSWPYASPVVSGSNIYMGLRNGDLAVVSTYKRRPVKTLVTLPAGISSTPAISGDGYIFVGCDDGYLYAISETGEIAWKYQTGAGIHSSPAISDGTVFVGSRDGKVYAFGQ